MNESDFFEEVNNSTLTLVKARLLLMSPTDLRRLKEAHRFLGYVILRWESLEGKYVSDLRATSRSY